MAKAEVKQPVVYLDLAYKSRTIVLPDMTSHPVAAGRITADSPELEAYLDSHPEFQRHSSARAGS